MTTSTQGRQFKKASNVLVHCRGCGKLTHSSLDGCRGIDLCRECIEARHQAETDTANNARLEKAAAVATWWAKEGKTLWEGAIELPVTPHGQSFKVITYIPERYQDRECRTVIVHVETRKNWKEEDEVCINTSGMVSTKYATRTPEQHLSISGSTSSQVNALTLEEALYDIVH